MARDPRQDVVTDLMRSSWAVETARSQVYRMWALADARFESSAETALRGAAIFERELSRRNRRTDPEVAEGHAEWIASLLGDDPRTTPLADWFVARLGDWVHAHAGELLAEGAERLAELHESDKQNLSVPEMPAAPPFEPVRTPPGQAPGDAMFRFAILGDIHVGSPRGEAMARAAIADINDSGADLTIQLGDLADHGTRAEFALAKEVMGELAMPWEVVTGNHDMYSTEEDRLSGREYFTEHFRPPDGHMIEHKGHRFVLLDSAEEVASPFAPYNLVTGQFIDGNGGAIVRGSLTTPQHEILAEVAAPGSPPSFVFLHHPTQPFVSFPPIVFGLRDADTGRLNAVCDSGNVYGIFAGHTHRNKVSGHLAGVPVTEVGIPRDYPFGYALVDVTPNGYAYRFHQITDENLLQEAYPRAGEIQRNYARGQDSDRAFTWSRSAGT